MGHLSSRPIFSRLPASAITALRSRSGSSATLAFPCGLVPRGFLVSGLGGGFRGMVFIVAGDFPPNFRPIVVLLLSQAGGDQFWCGAADAERKRGRRGRAGVWPLSRGRRVWAENFQIVLLLDGVQT
jgi:hypothetical protein